MPFRTTRFLLPLVLTGTLLLAACSQNTPTPVWNAPTNSQVAALAAEAGLVTLGKEGTVEHIHAHLTVTVDNKQVTVPAHIGIDTQRKKYSQIHTHDTSGIIHIESATVGKFYLRQAFTEWGVNIGAHTVDSYTAGKNGAKINVYINHKLYTGDLTTLQLHNLQDIVIAITTDGTTPKVTPRYVWPAGYVRKA